MLSRACGGYNDKPALLQKLQIQVASLEESSKELTRDVADLKKKHETHESLLDEVVRLNTATSQKIATFDSRMENLEKMNMPGRASQHQVQQLLVEFESRVANLEEISKHRPLAEFKATTPREVDALEKWQTIFGERVAKLEAFVMGSLSSHPPVSLGADSKDKHLEHVEGTRGNQVSMPEDILETRFTELSQLVSGLETTIEKMVAEQQAREQLDCKVEPQACNVSRDVLNANLPSPSNDEKSGSVTLTGYKIDDTESDRAEISKHSLSSGYLPKETAFQKLLHVLDRFKTDDAQRDPSFLGAGLSLLILTPLVILYIVLWIISYHAQPPMHTVETKWSMSKGPYLLDVQCNEGAKCWLWLTGCMGSMPDDANVCIELQPLERRTLQTCYSMDPREAFQVRWIGPYSGLKVWSMAASAPEHDGDPPMMPMYYDILPGVQYLTYVHTTNYTLEESSPARHRIEWFPQWVSATLLNASENFCTFNTAPDWSGQLIMQSSFYEIEVEPLPFWSALLGDAGGAYSAIFSAMFWLYVGIYAFSNRISLRQYVSGG